MPCVPAQSQGLQTGFAVKIICMCQYSPIKSLFFHRNVNHKEEVDFSWHGVANIWIPHVNKLFSACTEVGACDQLGSVNSF